jgi:hypothetical protein
VVSALRIGDRVQYASPRGVRIEPRAVYEVVAVEDDGYVIVRGVSNAGQDMGRDWRASAWRLERVS